MIPQPPVWGKKKEDMSNCIIFLHTAPELPVLQFEKILSAPTLSGQTVNSQHLFPQFSHPLPHLNVPLSACCLSEALSFSWSWLGPVSGWALVQISGWAVCAETKIRPCNRETWCRGKPIPLPCAEVGKYTSYVKNNENKEHSKFLI